MSLCRDCVAQVLHGVVDRSGVATDRLILRAGSLRGFDRGGGFTQSPALEVAPRQRVFGEDVVFLRGGAFGQRDRVGERSIVLGEKASKPCRIWRIESPSSFRERV